MKRTTTAIGLLIVAALFIAGCASDPILGTVRTLDGPESGSAAPDILFTTTKGIQTSLSKVSRDIEIVAFTSHGEGGCGKLKPEVLALREQLSHFSITVVQVAVPNEKCPHGAGCLQVTGPRAHFVALCDDDRTAWKAYGEPKPNTAFLIDETRQIVSVASLDNLSSFSWDAERLGQEIVRREPLSQGPE